MAVAVGALRRLAVGAQGFTPRLGTAGEDDVETTIRRLSAVQLDPVAVVTRSHRIVIASRAGAYPEDAVGALLARGRIFEYWAHERCLLPIDAYPLVRDRMHGPARWPNYDRALREHPEIVQHVRERLRSEGALPSRAFEGERAPDRPWKPAAGVLDALWDVGELAIAGRSGGERVYDLAERVIPREWLEAPVRSEAELLRELAVRAIRARGVLTEAAIREHWRLRGGRQRLQPQLDLLAGEGVLRALDVEDDGPPVYVDATADLDGEAGRPAVLLSPFDNLLWDRPLVERLFGFSHLIEIYKRAPERRYGYYVLPLLWGDRLVGRADLKADRRPGVLRVLAFHREPGVRPSKALDAAFERALGRVAAIAGVASIQR